MLLTVNAGSSSIPLVAFAHEATEPRILASYHGSAEHARAEHLLRDFITRNTLGEFALVAHRVVHGSDTLMAPCLIDAHVEAEIECQALAEIQH